MVILIFIKILIDLQSLSCLVLFFLLQQVVQQIQSEFHYLWGKTVFKHDEKNDSFSHSCFVWTVYRFSPSGGAKCGSIGGGGELGGRGRLYKDSVNWGRDETEDKAKEDKAVWENVIILKAWKDDSPLSASMEVCLSRKI